MHVLSFLTILALSLSPQISQYELMHQHYPMPSASYMGGSLSGFDASAAYSAQLATQQMLRNSASTTFSAYGMSSMPTYYG